MLWGIGFRDDGCPQMRPCCVHASAQSNGWETSDGLGSERARLVYVMDLIRCQWRDPITDEEMVDLVVSHGGNASAGWWSRVSQYSLGWISARDPVGLLVGFVNVAWDGCDHAFLIDTKTRGTHQRRGVGREMVRLAVQNAAAAGCEWLHVDFRAEHARFYVDACGFVPTDAGLVICDPVPLRTPDPSADPPQHHPGNWSRPG